MTEGTPPDALLALRAAAEGVARLDRETVGAVGAVGTGPGAGSDETAFDATGHAQRFEVFHDALVAVLADLDRS